MELTVQGMLAAAFNILIKHRFISYQARSGMCHLHLKVKCHDRSVCTGSTNSKSKYMHFGGVFVTLEACLGWNDNIQNDSQLVTVGFIHIQEAHSAQN